MAETGKWLGNGQFNMSMTRKTIDEQSKLRQEILMNTKLQKIQQWQKHGIIDVFLYHESLALIWLQPNLKEGPM